MQPARDGQRADGEGDGVELGWTNMVYGEKSVEDARGWGRPRRPISGAADGFTGTVCEGLQIRWSAISDAGAGGGLFFEVRRRGWVGAAAFLGRRRAGRGAALPAQPGGRSGPWTPGTFGQLADHQRVFVGRSRVLSTSAGVAKACTLARARESRSEGLRAAQHQDGSARPASAG